MIPYHCRQMRHDIDIYINSRQCGFFSIHKAEEYLMEYEKDALETAKKVPWNCVVLYAVFEYSSNSESILSADFMMLEMPFEEYVSLTERLCESSRFFFIRGRKECYEDENKIYYSSIGSGYFISSYD
ncbi:MAG: hypothetical protein K2J37_02530 [Ruminococcus sp.]|nr:hypothetical protein [Ruminococcus sp.]MDE6784596.1 hypothetical protein [Ruminococcus sp.]